MSKERTAIASQNGDEFCFSLAGLKAKARKLYITRSYADILTEILGSMFDYDGFPESIDKRFIELYLLYTGKCAFYKKNGELIVSTCQFSGEPDAYGIGKDLICTTFNGTVTTFTDWKNSNDVVVMLNNNIGEEDKNIFWFEDMLTEVDVSMNAMVLNSRYTPVGVCQNEKQKIGLEAIFDASADGKPHIMVSNNMLSEIENGKSGIEVVNVTDPTMSDKLQYLSNFHDDLLRRFYFLYGMDTQNQGSKLAQMSVEEVNSGSNSSFILPHNRYHFRQMAIDELNNKFGLSVSVFFTEPWQSRMAHCEEEVAEDETEEIEEPAEEPVEEVEEPVEEREEENE